MNDYVKRMKQERNELQNRLSNLCNFIGTEKFLSLSPANRILLENQKTVMSEYCNILTCRIELDEP